MIAPPVIRELVRLLALEKVEEEGELRCVECGATSPPEDSTGWQAHLTIDGELAVYCPACAAREFGDEA